MLPVLLWRLFRFCVQIYTHVLRVWVGPRVCVCVCVTHGDQRLGLSVISEAFPSV